jgi:hypothetical protein
VAPEPLALLHDRLVALGRFVKYCAAPQTLLVVAVGYPKLPRDQEIALVAIRMAALLGTALIFAFHPLIAAADRAQLFSGRVARTLDAARAVAALGSAHRPMALIGLSLLSVLAWICAVSAIATTVGDMLPLQLLWLAAILADVAQWMPLSLKGSVCERRLPRRCSRSSAPIQRRASQSARQPMCSTTAMVISGALAVSVDVIAALAGSARRATS